MALRGGRKIYGKLGVPSIGAALAQLVGISVAHHLAVKLGNQVGVGGKHAVRAGLKGLARGCFLLERYGRVYIGRIDSQDGVGIGAGRKADDGSGHEKGSFSCFDQEPMVLLLCGGCVTVEMTPDSYAGRFCAKISSTSSSVDSRFRHALPA